LPIALSLIVPAFNERESLPTLVGEVRAALTQRFDWQLVIVNDGSDDGSRETLTELCASDPRVEVVHLPRNLGQSVAILAGVARARHGLLATMDADLQQDPGDLVALHRALGSGDAAVGYRQIRCDAWIRRFGSRVGNGVRNAVTGDRIRDSGCSLRLVRRAALESLVPFDGMHRFLPTLLRIQGHTVVEHPVSHRPRAFGRSKYGTWGRAIRGVSDVLAVRWMAKRLIREKDLSGDTEDPGEVRNRSERRPPRSA